MDNHTRLVDSFQDLESPIVPAATNDGTKIVGVIVGLIIMAFI